MFVTNQGAGDATLFEVVRRNDAFLWWSSETATTNLKMSASLSGIFYVGRLGRARSQFD